MKTRAAIVIIISLVIGMFIGFVGANQLHHHKTKDFRSLNSKDSFKDRLFNRINPSSDQIEILTPIVEDYALRFDSLRKCTYQQYMDFIDEFHKTLEPYLTEEQIKAEEEFAHHFKKPHDKKGEEKDEKVK
ncbi:MAG: hypothetical protein K9H49_18785 [Bacteroidales bacterium]|nr:hypothetical protein [Bacteroidales bacterium]